MMYPLENLDPQVVKQIEQEIQFYTNIIKSEIGNAVFRAAQSEIWETMIDLAKTAYDIGVKETERIQWETERQQFNENFAATIKGLNAILTALTPLNPVETVATLSLIKAGMDNPVEEVLKHRHTHEPQ